MQIEPVASGITGLTVVTTGTARPTTCAFFSGRVFYGGIQSQGYNARIYFSQILSNISQAGKCYQSNDPSSQMLLIFYLVMVDLLIF